MPEIIQAKKRPNMSLDIKNSFPLVTSAVAALSSSNNTAMTAPNGSTGYDSLDYRALNFVIQSGTLADADATFSVQPQESDETNGTYTSIADIDMSVAATDLAFAFGDDSVARQVTIKPRKRFVRIQITPSNNSSAAAFTVVAQGAPLIGGTA